MDIINSAKIIAMLRYVNDVSEIKEILNDLEISAELHSVTH